MHVRSADCLWCPNTPTVGLSCLTDSSIMWVSMCPQCVCVSTMSVCVCQQCVCVHNMCVCLSTEDERSDNSIFSDHLFTEQDDRGDPPEDGNVEGDDQLSDHLFDDAKTSSTVSETSSNTDSNPDGHESDSDTIRRDDHNIFPQREPYEINPEVSYDLNHHEADPDLYSDQRGQEGDPSVSDEEKQANTDSFNERNAGTDHAVNAVDPSARNGRYAEPTPPPDNDEGNSAAAEDAEKNYKLLSEQPTNQNEGYPPSQLTKK